MKNIIDTISDISIAISLVGITTSAISIVPLVNNKTSFYAGLGMAGTGMLGLFTTNIIGTYQLLKKKDKNYGGNKKWKR